MMGDEGDFGGAEYVDAGLLVVRALESVREHRERLEYVHKVFDREDGQVALALSGLKEAEANLVAFIRRHPVFSS